MRTSETEQMESRQSGRAERSYAGEVDSGGLFGSIQRVLGTVLALFQSRIELFAVELREEKKRAFAVVCWGVALVFLGFMVTIAIMGIVVFLFWDEAFAVLVGFSVFYAVLAAASFFAMRSKLGKIPFEETVAQLKKDRESVSEESI